MYSIYNIYVATYILGLENVDVRRLSKLQKVMNYSSKLRNTLINSKGFMSGYIVAAYTLPI